MLRNQTFKQQEAQKDLNHSKSFVEQNAELLGVEKIKVLPWNYRYHIKYAQYSPQDMFRKMKAVTGIYFLLGYQARTLDLVA